MLKPLLTRFLLLAGISATAASLSAQVFTAPVAQQSIFPASSAYVRPATISNYSLGNSNSAYGTADLYISGWSGGATSGFGWRFTKPGLPNSIYGQGVFPYTNVTDVEVGLANVGGTIQIYVAYYKNGSGHYMDIYKLTGSTATPIAFSSTMTLSNSTKYGRIRFDSHKLYGTAVTWCYPGKGIQTIVGNVGGWGNILTLTGTQKCEDPDLAFSHSNGPLNVHYAYHDKGAQKIIESVADWNVMLTAVSTITPTIEDVNSVGSSAALRLVLDCPDHYDVENWAYTYCTNSSDISVRYIDYHSTATPTTSIINNGSLGNIPTTGNYKNFSPALHYGDGSAGTQVQVGWYVTDGSAFNAYIGLHVKESFTAILSNPDYMLLPNATTSSIYPLRPGIAYSKASDVGGIAPAFMYASFYDLVGGTYQFHHAFHPWAAPVFKGSAGYHPECGHDSHTSKVLTATEPVRVYPNPFTDVLTASFTAKESGMVTLQLVDITGRIASQLNSKVEAGTQMLNINNLDKIPAGIYQLNVVMDGTIIGHEKLMKN